MMNPRAQRQLDTNAPQPVNVVGSSDGLRSQNSSMHGMPVRREVRQACRPVFRRYLA
jgi:hypothetical protein